MKTVTTKLSVAVDQMISAVYVELDTPADEINVDNNLGEKFCDRVRELTKTKASDTDLKKRLLSLRKMGKLPRLRRKYNGRNLDANATVVSKTKKD